MNPLDSLRSTDHLLIIKGIRAGGGIEDKVATHISQLEANGFGIIPGYQLNRSEGCVPEQAGVYAISVRNGDRLLDALGYDLVENEPWLDREGRVHLYTGSSGNMRFRARQHFFGCMNRSSMRKTLLAAEELCGAITATGLPMAPAPNVEIALDIWLITNASISVARCANHRSREDEIISLAPTPLNIQGRRWTPFAQRLIRMTAEWESAMEAEAQKRRDCSGR